MDGSPLGSTVGIFVSTVFGDSEGWFVGSTEGKCDGFALFVVQGTADGAMSGILVSREVQSAVGDSDG